MFESIFQSIGEVTRVYTLVDYYTYIKGLEYLICVGFFILFNSFYKSVIVSKKDDLNEH
ncbi:MAG: hypothetical protein P8X63_00445 [Desulfuromonadaceae bacterium]